MVTAADRKDQPVGWFGYATETKCIPSRRQRPVRGMLDSFGYRALQLSLFQGLKFGVRSRGYFVGPRNSRGKLRSLTFRDG
jgi:hypothetical protein